MRIWYQSLVAGGRAPSYFEGLAERAQLIARPGVEVHFESMPQGVYGPHAPAEVVIYPYLMSLHIQFILDNALRAQAEGYDVFAVGSVQDPGLEEVRSLLDIPVVSYGEAAMHFACILASRFVVIAFQDGFGKGIYAAGVPFSAVTIGGQQFIPGQANNFYIFPAVGMAIFATQANRVTDQIFIEAARAVADQVPPDLLQKGLLYPEQTDILETEIKTAARVANLVLDSDLARVDRPQDMEQFIRQHVYKQEYPVLG